MPGVNGASAPRVQAELPTSGVADAPSLPRRLSWQSVFGLRAAGVVYALALLVAGLVALTYFAGRPNYLSPNNVANLLEQAAFVGILAIAMAILLISGSFDLSVGSLAAFCAVLAACLVNELGIVPAIILTLLAGVLGGSINGGIHHLIGVNPFIVTLGTLTAFRGLTLILAEGRTVMINDPARVELIERITATHVMTPNLLAVFGVVCLGGAILGVSKRLPRTIVALAFIAACAALCASFFWSYRLNLAMPTLYWFGVALLAWFFLRFTVMGKRLYATGGNQKAAGVAGIRIAFYKVVPFCIVGAAAGLVGILFAGRLGAVDPNAFAGVELTVIASGVVGGVSIFGGAGSVIKTLVGTLLLFTLANGFNILNVNAYFQLVFAGFVTIAAAAMYVVTDRAGRT